MKPAKNYISKKIWTQVDITSFCKSIFTLCFHRCLLVILSTRGEYLWSHVLPVGWYLWYQVSSGGVYVREDDYVRGYVQLVGMAGVNICLMGDYPSQHET